MSESPNPALALLEFERRIQSAASNREVAFRAVNDASQVLDFDQAVLQVSATNRDQSPLLTEPLALTAGGTPHGFKPFASTADSGYIAIRGWIQSGQLR